MVAAMAETKVELMVGEKVVRLVAMSVEMSAATKAVSMVGMMVVQKADEMAA